MLSKTLPPNASNKLHDWRVMEAVSPTGIRTRHLCGQNAACNMGVSTSAIQEFDPVAMTVKTRSGNTYTLIGQPGDSRIGDSAWQKWCKDNGVFAEVDVTGEYVNVIPETIPETTITFKRLGVPATC